MSNANETLSTSPILLPPSSNLNREQNPNLQEINVTILSSSIPHFKNDETLTLNLEKHLGKGTYSHVYSIKKRKYVVKIMKPSYKKKELKAVRDGNKHISECKHFYMRENFREIDVTKRLINAKKYPKNLVKVVAYGQLSSPVQTKEPFPKKYFPKGTYVIVERYYRCFQKYFAKSKPTHIQLLKLIFDMKQAFKQLLYTTGYIHLDPKLSNIYISRDGKKFMLSDFNLVQKYIYDKEEFTSYGTYYLHPQRVCSLAYLPYYSLGITLLELVYDKAEVYYLDKLKGVLHSNHLEYLLANYKNSDNYNPSMYSFIVRCVELQCKVTPTSPISTQSNQDISQLQI